MVSDWLKALAATTAIMVSDRISLALAFVGGSQIDQLPDAGTMQWAARELGAWAIVLIVLFFYRRDWKTAVDFWRDQNAVLTKLVTEHTESQYSVAAALRENTSVTHGLKRVIEQQIGPIRGSGTDDT